MILKIQGPSPLLSADQTHPKMGCQVAPEKKNVLFGKSLQYNTEKHTFVYPSQISTVPFLKGFMRMGIFGTVGGLT